VTATGKSSLPQRTSKRSGYSRRPCIGPPRRIRGGRLEFCTTKSVGGRCYGKPGIGCAVIAARREWMAGLSRPSRRKERTKEIQAQLLAKQYRPQAVRRVFIPKGRGHFRALGIRLFRTASFKARSVLYSNRFSKRTFAKGRMGFGRGVVVVMRLRRFGSGSPTVTAM
jgi:hypothetical protein